MTRRATRSTLFPYTTLFRSKRCRYAEDDVRGCWQRCWAWRQSRPMPMMRSKFTTARLPRPAEIGRATSELQSHSDLVCRLLLEKKKKNTTQENERLTR